MRNPNATRLARRGGIWIMMWAVFAGMALEWLHLALTALFRPVLAKLHLDKVAPWLSEHSLWWLLPIGIVLVPVIAVAKIVEIWLLVNHFPIGVAAFVFFKVAAVGMGNLFVSAYAERLLQFAWIARTYASYADVRDRLKAWIRRQEWYLRAVRLRDAYRVWKRDTITLIDFGRRAAHMHRCCFSFFTFAR